MFDDEEEHIVEHVQPTAQENISMTVLNKFYKMANEIYVTSQDRINECESLIIYLEKNVMDENEEDADNELNRKAMRPLTNDLMNHVKMNRNLLKLLRSDIVLMNTKNQISSRLIDRFTNICKEVTNLNNRIFELGAEFNSKFSEFLKKTSISPLVIKKLDS